MRKENGACKVVEFGRRGGSGKPKLPGSRKATPIPLALLWCLLEPVRPAKKTPNQSVKSQKDQHQVQMSLSKEPSPVNPRNRKNSCAKQNQGENLEETRRKSRRGPAGCVVCLPASSPYRTSARHQDARPLFLSLSLSLRPKNKCVSDKGRPTS